MAEWVAAVTLLVSLVTLYFVVRTDRRDQRHAPRVELRMTTLGRAHNGANELLWHLWSARNVGSSDAQTLFLQGVGCEIVYDNDFRPVSMIKAGESIDLKVETLDTKQAWVLVAWQSPYDQLSTYVEWFVPDDDASDLHKTMLGRPPLARWRRWLPRAVNQWLEKTEPVGPGGAIMTRVPLRSRKTIENLVKAVSLADPKANEKAETLLNRLRPE